MNYSRDFIFNNKEKINNKINSIIKNGDRGVHLVLDFDRTITKSTNYLGEDVTTWEILGKHLNKSAKKRYDYLYNKYRPLEVKNKIRLKDAMIWWEGILELYKENRLKWSDISKDVEKRMPIREGVKELFDVCIKKNIPTVIISAGIKDVIELWCQRFEVKPSVILSTNLYFDSKGFISGWDKKSLIHILNKKEQGHKEINKIKRQRPKAILIGDHIKDADMVSGRNNVLRIMVDDPRGEDLYRNDEFYNLILKKFDLIIKNKTLYPIVDLINKL